jgi:hypothetical protein
MAIRLLVIACNEEDAKAMPYRKPHHFFSEIHSGGTIMKKSGSFNFRIACLSLFFPGSFLQVVEPREIVGDTYPISGQVTDVATGLPVPEAHITLLDAVTREMVRDDICPVQRSSWWNPPEFRDFHWFRNWTYTYLVH